MAKGSQFKEEILNKLLEFFPNSFLYNNGKEIRICGQENGEDIQIKVTLTCAKENVIPGQDNELPGAAANKSNEINFEDTSKTTTAIEPTEDEKANVQDLLRALGL